MTGFGKLAFVEAKLFGRERVAVAALLGIPVALVVGFGLIPGFGKPDKSLGGQIATEYIASLGVAIVIVMLGLNGIPSVMGTYRERGILRRLSATPVRPLTLLTAKLMVWLATGSAMVLNDACPEPFTVTLDAKTMDPSVKVTLPTGTPPLEVVVEVKVTGWPKTEGFGEEVAVVVVVYMFWTVCTVLPLLAAKFVSEA